MPISRLPDELLTHIFVKCLHARPYLKPNRNAAPLVLVRVCRRWRDVALQTTELWCSLSAVQEDCCGLLPMHEARVNGYAAWLSRSGNRPLSLAVPFELLGSRRWRQEWAQLLLSYRRRFKRLRLVDERGVDSGLNELLDGADMLTSLAVHLDVLDNGERDLRITCPLPSLKNLFLDVDNVGVATLPDAAWANLTRLAVILPRAYGNRTDEFLGLLSCCPNLQTLVYGPANLADAEPGELQLQSPRSHPNLRSLTAVLADFDAPQPGSPILTLPALLHLRVQHRFADGWEDAYMEGGDDSQEDATVPPPPPPQRVLQMAVVRNEDFYMFDAGWTSITHLDVTCFGDIPVFHTIMELCPNLQVLEVVCYGWKDRLASRLTYPCSLASLPTRLTYPSLRELFIGINAPLGNVLEMVTLPGLQRLTIRATDCGEHDDLRAMLLRSRCALESLEVRQEASGGTTRTRWTEAEREELLASLPTLVALELYPFSC